ncbi:flagellar protein FlgN [Alkaliphilus crotonatoxidans]
MKPEVVVDYLYRISEGKLQLMEQLLKLTKQQSVVLKDITDENLAELNQVIEEKQQVIEKVDLLDKEFVGKFEGLKELLGIDSFADMSKEPVVGFKNLKETIEKIVDVRNEIEAVDKANTEKAQMHMAAIKQELQTVKIGKQVNKNYGKKYVVNEPILFDKKK